MEQRKAVGYIRTAVYDADGSNIKNQESAIRQYCAQNEICLEAIFTDNGVSGNNFARKGWVAMLKYLTMNKGAIRSLVIANLDRISRQYSLYAVAVERLNTKYGLKIHSVNKGLDLPDFFNTGIGRKKVKRSR